MDCVQSGEEFFFWIFAQDGRILAVWGRIIEAKRKHMSMSASMHAMCIMYIMYLECEIQIGDALS